MKKLCLILGAACLPLTLHAADFDLDAAKALAKQNNCLKCHGIDKDKDATSYKKIAEKYKGKADAEDKLVKHLQTGPTVKLLDGKEEEHKKIKTSPANDEAQVRNIVRWVLSTN